jgi:hypothetical protein
MANYKYSLSEEINEEVLEFTAGERDRDLSEIRRGFEEDGSTTINLAGLKAGGDRNAISKENGEADQNEVKRVSV